MDKLDKQDWDKLTSEHPVISPMDEWNQVLVGHVFPPDHENPKPNKPYHLVVIGGGTAGLVSAGGAALLGLRVALIDESLLGGDCLNTGCVPSKALLHAATQVSRKQSWAADAGITLDLNALFHESMSYVREKRAAIAPHDSVRRFTEMGVDIYQGRAQFESPKTVSVNQQILSFYSAVIATGGRAYVPDIPGLKASNYLTNESLFSLEDRPGSIAILGGGPIGCEMSQAFARLGCQVSLIESGARLLGHDDADAADCVQKQLVKDGVQLFLNSRLSCVTQLDSGVRLELNQQGNETSIEADHLLVATGRSANVTGLGLEKAGVDFDAKAGVRISETFQTSMRHIFACGDVAAGTARFTHAADMAARLIIQNVVISQLLPVRMVPGLERLVLSIWGGKKRSMLIPHCTYTKPELAHVGRKTSKSVTVSFADNDRAIVESEEQGFLKLWIDRRKRIKGATIAGVHAGELLPLLTLMIRKSQKITDLNQIVYAYPTRSEILKHVADEMTMTSLSSIKKVISPIFPS